MARTMSPFDARGPGAPARAGRGDPSTGPAAGVARPARRPARGWRRAATIAAALLLSACSALRIGYDNADSLLTYTATSYLELDQAQQDLVRERVQALHAWHRGAELPGYARLIQHAVDRIGGADPARPGAPVDADEVLALQQEVNARMRRLGERAAPALAELALTLRAEQIDHFERRLARDAARNRQKLLPRADRDALEEGTRLWTGRIEEWVGELSPAQVDAVRASVAARPEQAKVWIEEREQRRRELVDLLREVARTRPPAAEVATRLKAYFASLERPADPRRAERLAGQRRASAELAARIINLADAPQRAQLSERLGGYIADLSALAAGGSATPGS